MEDPARLYSGSVPALYDRYRGPVFFEPFARDLADRLADLRAGNLLEIAAGTGIVTRVLARVLPETVSIIASDINQAMLDFAAAQRPANAGGAGLRASGVRLRRPRTGA